MTTSTTATGVGAFRAAWASFVARLTPRFLLYAAVILAVTTAAAYNSYGHQLTVAHLAHQTGLAAATLPVSVDGMLAAASLAMAEDKANGCRPRLWARLAFWLGAIVSVAANLAAVYVEWGWDILSLSVSGWPPVALLFVVEIMARRGKPIVDPAEVEAAQARSESAKKAAATRKANAAKGTSQKPRTTTRKKASAAHPVSPGVVPFSELDADKAKVNA